MSICVSDKKKKKNSFWNSLTKSEQKSKGDIIIGLDNKSTC